jgi:hypothetical protein
MTMTDDSWRQGVNSRLSTLDDRMSSIEKQAAVDEVHRVNVEKRLGSIEDTLKWLVRLILSALILALMAFAIGGGLAG